VSMPDVGRLIPEEAPDELADLIASFVSPHIKGSAEEIVISSEIPGTTEGGTA